LNFLDRFSKKKKLISDFIKIHPVGAELFHPGGRMDGHDEADSRFSQFCKRTLKGVCCSVLQTIALWNKEVGKNDFARTQEICITVAAEYSYPCVTI
jgi:hypothetical protein